MKLRYKLAAGAIALIFVSCTVLAIVISYEVPCGDKAVTDRPAAGMRAVLAACYGPPEVLTLRSVEIPQAADDEVLVRIHAAAVNPLDYHYMRGKPYIMRLMGAGIGKPEDVRSGVDFAGTVEAVGRNVRDYQAGDAVFGSRSGAFAEYVVVPVDGGLVKKPEDISFAEAAALPVAAVTALQALRDSGRVKKGDRVLVNGASGGVGSYAVQIAKSMGAEVTGVCSTRNQELVRSLGADHMIDYKKENYIHAGIKYDVIIDMVGNHSLLANRRVMETGGRLVIVGGPKDDPWLGPLYRPLFGMLLSRLVDQDFLMFLAKIRKDDLQTLASMLETGEIRSVIDRRYDLTEIREAISYSESGRARGKIIIEM